MAKFFGKSGLFAYSAVVVIAANMQVLKLVQYSSMNEPIALGTVLFSTVFVVDNILTEYYGVETARKCVAVSFFSYLFFSLVMKITIWHPEVDCKKCINLHRELKNVFSPCFVFFISSLASYAVSQLTDILVFSTLKKLMKSKCLSFRSFISMAISTFVDNFVFSVLAWIVFSKHPISLFLVLKTYVFTAYMIRLIIAALCVPLVRLSGTVISGKLHV
ncbi:MAG: queuosine precursor transporter [Holosporaceae bacterium]|jgi:uncharacterized integral membrane protein (TIGR00697 family)|nr:queuosine precursor transporter [Holosporaceae bacterium]